MLRTYDQRPFLYPEHMRRLRASAARIALPCPLDRRRDAGADSRDRRGGGLEGDAYVRILLTRGAGEIVYDPRACPAPTIVVIVKPHVDPPAGALADGVALSLATVVRNHPGSVDPAIKSNNLLNNALAMQQAYREGTFEALMKNHRGELCECAQSNIFFVRDGVVLTPPVDAGLLVGVTRAYVLELAAALQRAAVEQVLHEADLDSVQEAFLTSTTREIVPVVRIGERSIGNGRPGPVTRQLMDAFATGVATRLS